MYKKYLLIVIIIAFICLSCVSASEDSNMSMNSGSDISLDNSYSPSNFNDLKGEIESLNPGDTYNINQDYIFEVDGIGPFVLTNEGIKITADNVTINGNGHVIDGNYNTAIFKVTGNNVKIINLNIINSQYHGYNIPVKTTCDNIKIGECGYGLIISEHLTDMSPVYWLGDNGVIDNCIFNHNTAINGGAITWMGNNGLINNTRFINNTVDGIAGAIYMGGENNIISNCDFMNSFSPLSREAIYLDPGRKNITVKNVKFDEEIITDGQLTNISANNMLYKSFVDISPFEDVRQFDIIPILYKSITLGGVNLLSDNQTTYFCSYNSTTGDFVLSTYINYGEIMEEYAGIEYIRQFSFKNITDFSQVFIDAAHVNYVRSTTQIGTILINSASDYSKLLAKQNYPKFFTREKDETRQLSIIFTKKLSINSNSCFNLDSTNCDIVTLYGNDSSITAKNEAKNEDKWVTNSKTIFIASNIQVGGFNTAIENKGGAVILNNVKLHDNYMDYIMDPDWGAAILNTGYCQCNNCTFTNNYCCNGGAIFNYGRLEINNCTFKGNTAYGKGDNVLNVGDGIVFVNGNKITGSKGPVTYTKDVDTILSGIIIAIAAVATFVLVMGGIIFSAITLNPLIAVTCIGISVAIFGIASVIVTAYDGPRNNIKYSQHRNYTPANVTAPIKIIDEIVFN